MQISFSIFYEIYYLCICINFLNLVTQVTLSNRFLTSKIKEFSAVETINILTIHEKRITFRYRITVRAKLGTPRDESIICLRDRAWIIRKMERGVNWRMWKEWGGKINNSWGIWYIKKNFKTLINSFDIHAIPYSISYKRKLNFVSTKNKKKKKSYRTSIWNGK